jgi:hypothetical protein
MAIIKYFIPDNWIKYDSVVNELVAEGMHEVRWNGRDRYGQAVSSGVYLIRIKADGFEKTGKVMMIR